MVRQNKGLPCNEEYGSVDVPRQFFEMNFFDFKEKKIINRDKAVNNQLMAIFTDELESKCPLNINDIRKARQAKVVRIRCYCTAKLCRSYVFETNMEPEESAEVVNFKILTSSNQIDHHSGGASGLKRPTAGLDKVNMVERAKGKHPKEMMDEDRQRARPDYLVKNNMDIVASKCVYQNASCIARKANTRHEDEMISLALIRQSLSSENNYLLKICIFPAELYMASLHQLLAFITFNRSPYRVLKPFSITGDATCGIGKQYDDGNQMVGFKFYRIAVHCPMLNTGRSEVVPLFEFTILHETSAAILQALIFMGEKLTQLAKDKNLPLQTPLVDCIIVDKALASISAFLQFLNRLTIVGYSNKIYNAVYNRQLWLIEALALMKICAVHSGRSWLSQAQKLLPNLSKASIRFLKLLHLLIPRCTSYQFLLNGVWLMMVTIFSNKTQTAEVLQAKKFILHHANACLKSDNDNLLIHPWEFKGESESVKVDTEKLENQSGVPMYKQSGFYHDMLHVYERYIETNKLNDDAEPDDLDIDFEDVIEDLDDDDEDYEEIDYANEEQGAKNDLYSPALLQYWLKSQSVYLPMVTAFDWQLKKSQFAILTHNQTAESGFGEIKQLLLADKKVGLNARIDVSIQALRKRTDGQIKMIDFGDNGTLPTTLKSKKKPMKESEITEDDIALIESIWRRKRKNVEGSNYLPLARNNIKLKETPQKGLQFTETQIVNSMDWYFEFKKKEFHCFPLFVRQRRIAGVEIKAFLNNEWVDLEVLVLLLRIFAEKYSDIEIVDPTLANVVFFGTSAQIKRALLKDTPAQIKNNQERSIWALLHDNHFTVVYTDKKEQVFGYVDSRSKTIKSDTEKTNLMFEKFKTYLIESKQDPNQWKVKILPHCYQKDGVHCGPQVIENAKQLMAEGTTKKEPRAMKAIRESYIATLINESDPINDCCFICAVDVPTERVDHCGGCNYLIHKNCLRNTGQLAQMCPICASYFTN